MGWVVLMNRVTSACIGKKPCSRRGWILLIAFANGCSGSDEGDGGESGALTATFNDGAESLEEACVFTETERFYGFHAIGEDFGIEASWGKDAITEPGAYETSALAGVSLSLLHQDPNDASMKTISVAHGTLTFTSYEPETDSVAGTFELTVTDGPDRDGPILISGNGSFECTR